MPTVHGNKYSWYSAGVNPWFAYFQYILCGLFYYLEDAAEVSYAHDATRYTPIKTNDFVIKEIEHFFEVFFQWCMNIFLIFFFTIYFHVVKVKL